jgi:tetratricopeptide (TPR) repeat protein
MFVALGHLLAQSSVSAIREGNKMYKENNFGQSATAYKKALSQTPENPLLNYNLGNAQFRSSQVDEALKSYENAIAHSSKKAVKEKAFYNKGVALSSQQKLQESIDAWKNALKLDPTDVQARENLQKALSQQKKEQKEKEQKKDQNEKDKKKDDKKENQDKNSPEQKSRLSKKQVEQLLKALAQKEKEVQQKMQSKNASPNRQEKDW